MVTVYKLTTQDNKTRKGYENECTWGSGVTHSGTGKGELCGPGYIHAYLSPMLAVLLNPIHANIESPKLWECSVSAIAKSDKDLKVGAVALTTICESALPTATDRTRVIFAILCAQKAQEATTKSTFGDKSWQVIYRKNISVFNEWAEAYKSGKSNADAARTAYAYAARAAEAAARAADAVYAYAARAAEAAARAADAADAVYAVYSAYSAYAAAAVYSAYSAVYSARAAEAAIKFDLVKIAADAFNITNKENKNG